MSSNEFNILTEMSISENQSSFSIRRYNTAQGLSNALRFKQTFILCETIPNRFRKVKLSCSSVFNLSGNMERMHCLQIECKAAND